jgi:hypothetical protein
MTDGTPSTAERLNEHCFCTTADIPALQRWLQNDLRARGLVQPLVDTHAHLFSASPVFVAREHIAKMIQIIAAVEAAIASASYRALVREAAPPVARIPQPTKGGLVSYDFHTGASGPKLIEINTNAGAAMLTAALRRAQRACCAEVEQLAMESPTGESLEAALWRMFDCEWRLARGATPLERIAIVDDRPDAQYLFPEFLLYQRLFESNKVAAVIAAPHELHYDNGVLWRGALRIDMVYNRLTDFYLRDPEHAALRHAYEHGGAVVVPHPYAHALYANKRNLALLTDDAILGTLGITDEHRRVLLAGIPRTLLVSSQDAESWWADRNRWFFKPATGYASRGSYRGDKLTRKTFAAIIEADYVAQQIVPPAERRTAAAIEQRPLKIDLRVFAYDGAALSIAARLYQGQTTNLRTPGGGFAPVYVVP